MAHTYCIDWTITYHHSEVIEAENREQALELAKRLLDSERFQARLFEAWDDGYTSYDGPNEPIVLDGEDVLKASMDEEDINYYLGLED